MIYAFSISPGTRTKNNFFEGEAFWGESINRELINYNHSVEYCAPMIKKITLCVLIRNDWQDELLSRVTKYLGKYVYK